MTQATDKTTKRLDDGARSPLRRFGLLALALACLAALGLLAAGCGASGSPAVANVASTTSTVASDTSTTATTATTTHGGSAGGAPEAGGSPAGPGGGGNHTVINIGNPTEGTKFAACMRKHGVPSFPDPNSQGLIQFGSSIDPHSPTLQIRESQLPGPAPCRLRPAANPGAARPVAAATARLLEMHARARDQRLPRPNRRRASANPTRRRPRPEQPTVPGRLQRMQGSPAGRACRAKPSAASPHRRRAVAEPVSATAPSSVRRGDAQGARFQVDPGDPGLA